MKVLVAVLISLMTIIVSCSSEDLIALRRKNCKIWPKVSKLPIECCTVPELFEPEIKNKCIGNCSRPSDSSFNDTSCCTIQCIFEETEIASDGKFGAEAAKKLLSKVFEKNEKIMKRLFEIVDKCDDQENKLKTTIDTGKAECARPQYGMILGCIYQEIFKACPESKPDSECKEIKDFMEECPMAQPPAYQKKPRSAKITKDNLGDAMREVIRDPKQIGQV